MALLRPFRIARGRRGSRRPGPAQRPLSSYRKAIEERSRSWGKDTYSADISTTRLAARRSWGGTTRPRHRSCRRHWVFARCLGPKHPNTSGPLAELGWCYRLGGGLEDASGPAPALSRPAPPASRGIETRLPNALNELGWARYQRGNRPGALAAWREGCEAALAAPHNAPGTRRFLLCPPCRRLPPGGEDAEGLREADATPHQVPPGVPCQAQCRYGNTTCLGRGGTGESGVKGEPVGSGRGRVASRGQAWLLRVVELCVRRGPCQVLIFSGCNYRPATGSLQPLAIGATVEETKPSEPSRQMCRFGRCSEPTGRNRE